MAISERLALLVTLDAKGAIKSFNDLGKAADKGLSKADTKLDKMSSRFQKVGAGMLATAGLAAVGLYKAGQAAGDLEQAVGGTEAVFGKASGVIDDYAKKAAQAAGLSESAFRQATTSIGGQLKGLGFSTAAAADEAVKLTQVAADLSATYGGTTAEAVQALGAAFRGEADPAERFNLFLNQTRVNAKAVELGLAASTSQVDANAKAQAVLALITEQSSDAQGQFAREADTAQGAMARFRAETDNLLAAVGGAVAPAIADLADGVGGLVKRFNDLTPAQQSVISQAALVGTGLLGLAGVTSFTVGKVIDARERFAELGKMTSGLRGHISDLNPAVKGLAGVFVVAGVAALAFSEDQKKVREGAKELRTEAEATGNSIEVTFRKKVSDAITENDRLRRSLHDAGFSFTEISTALTGTDDQYESFIRSLLKSSAGVDANVGKMTSLRNQYLEAGAQADTAKTHITGLRDATTEQGNAAGDAAGATADLTEEVEDQKAALDLATESANKFKEGLDKAFGDLTIEEAADRRAQAFSDMAAQFEDAQQNVKDAKQRVADLLATPVKDRSDTFSRDLADAQKAVQDAIDETSRKLDGNSEAALRNRENIRGAVEDVAALIQAHRDEGASLEDLEFIRALEKENLERQLEQLGFNKEEIGRYIGAIDAIPITKETTVTIDTAPAQLRIKELAESLVALAPDQQFSIDAAVIDRNLQRAQTRRAIGGPVTAGERYSTNEYLGAGKGYEWFAPANGTITPSGPGASTGTVVEQNITINNPVPEPASNAGRHLRRAALDMAS